MAEFIALRKNKTKEEKVAWNYVWVRALFCGRVNGEGTLFIHGQEWTFGWANPAREGLLNSDDREVPMICHAMAQPSIWVWWEEGAPRVKEGTWSLLMVHWHFHFIFCWSWERRDGRVSWNKNPRSYTSLIFPIKNVSSVLLRHLMRKTALKILAVMMKANYCQEKVTKIVSIQLVECVI